MPSTGHLDDAIYAVAEAGHLSVNALEEAAVRTDRELAQFRHQLGLDLETYKDVGVVLTGSFGRREVTDASDCDFLVLVRGLPGHHLINGAIEQVGGLAKEKGYRDVGAQGVFGDFAIGAELMARIGLDADSNVNTTRRLLVLFESTAIFQNEIRGELIRQLLQRYCADYEPAAGREASDPVTVPRFLLKDLARYWQTMAVDFGAKQWRAFRSDWHLRYVKLLTTRKILYAGSLMSLFRTPEHLSTSDPADRFGELITYLASECDQRVRPEPFGQAHGGARTPWRYRTNGPGRGSPGIQRPDRGVAGTRN